MRRTIGDVSGVRPGPLLVLTGGVHGNEPAGVEALEQVFAELAEGRVEVRGRVVGLAGNTAALARGKRFIDEDLNRIWTPELMDQRLTGSPVRGTNERREQDELCAAIDPLLAEPWDEVTLVDLHSTSGMGPPFAILSDKSEHRRLAEELGVPAVLGLHQNVPGTLIDWFERFGHHTLVVEGGQNGDARTCERLRAVVWLALAACGVIGPDAVDLEPHREVLRQATSHLPARLEVVLRWGIEPGERFKMEPGFENLQSIGRGRLLARTGRFGEVAVRAPFDGLLLLPKYQAQGSDGFFLAHDPEAAARVAERSA